MAKSYTSPGVFIEEIPKLQPFVMQVETAAVIKPAEFIILRYTDLFKESGGNRINTKLSKEIKNPGLNLKLEKANRFK